MQKLFENWRRFRKEVLKEQFEADALGYQAQGHTLDKLKCDAKKHPQCAELVDLGRQILSIGIPPLAIPEFKGAMQEFTDNPSLQNAGAAALALLASIPHLKGLTAAEKLSKTKQVIKTAEGTSAAMKGAPQYNQLASRIDDAAAAAKKEIKRLQDSVAGDLDNWLNSLMHIGSDTANQIFKLSKSKPGIVWKQVAYRGESFKDMASLRKRLGIPENYELLATKRSDGWSFIELKNHSLAPRARMPAAQGRAAERQARFYELNPGAKNIATSFTSDKGTAFRFSAGGKRNIQVVYETVPGSENLINIEKLGPVASMKTKNLGEAEILGLGDVKINGFWINN